MMYLQQSALQKGIRVFTKRGLSWVSVGHRDTWGKLDGVWRRGTAQEVMVVLDPAVRTLYWDYNLWELLGRPVEELNVQIVVGKNATLCGALHPTDPKPSLELSGGWALTTKFDIFLHGILLGASGWGGEPPVLQPDLVAINGREVAANHAATCVSDSFVRDYGRATNGSVVGLGTPRGNIYGQLFPANKGGRGGDCLRTNRPTTLHIMEGPGYIGMVLPGGGGGGSLPSYWRRFVGEYKSYANPNVGGVSGLFTVTGKYKQWSLAGWGGAIGCGASAAFNLAGPAGHPYSLATPADLSPPAAPDMSVCFATGRPVRPFNRAGMHVGAVSDGIANRSAITHPAKNISGRSASSGHSLGSDMYHAPLSELAASARVLPNDIVSSTPGSGVAIIVNQGSLSYADYSAIRSRFFTVNRQYYGRRLDLYERQAFQGGRLTTPEYGFDSLVEAIAASGRGGAFGEAGAPPAIGVSGSARAWSDTGVFGFSAFPYGGTDILQARGAAGRAIVGSEYVTIVGRRLLKPANSATAFNWAGASVPFE